MRNILKDLIDPSGKMFREKYVKAHYNNIYELINEFSYKNDLTNLSFKQQVYHYLNNITEKQYCKNPECNNEVKFRDSTIGYSLYCCNKCISLDPDIQKRKEETCLSKYGTKHQSSCEEIKKKKRETNQERYGYDTPLQNKEFLDKVKKTNLEKIGVEYPLQNKEILNKMKETLMKNYGVEHQMYSDEIKEKIKNTNNKRYGVDYPLQNVEILKKLKETNIERYGCECALLNNIVKEKTKNTFLEKYNVDRVENTFSSEEIKEKIKKTNIERFGCENPMQNLSIFDKMQHTSLSKKLHFSGLYYQGSYELDFLNRYSNKINIEKGKRIIYNKNKIYFCDFYLPDYNFLIEIKSSYWYKKYEQKNIDKFKECIKLGYNYIIIINKDYIEFDKILSNLF